MASRLKAQLQIVNLEGGQTRTFRHGLSYEGRPLYPDVIQFNNADIELVSCTTETITVVNNSGLTITSRILVESWWGQESTFSGISDFIGTPFIVRGGGASSSSTSTITTIPEIASTAEDTTLVGNIMANDSTTVGSLYVMQYTVAGQSGVNQAVGDLVTINGRGTFRLYSDGEYQFTPFADFHGAVPVITYQITNGQDIRLSTLTISVTPVNDGPVANPDFSLSFEGEPVTVAVLANDVDVDGNSLSITHVNGSPAAVNQVITLADATIVLNANNTITVTPDNGFEGNIIFEYTISDGTLSDTAEVTVQVGVDNIPLFSPFAPIIVGNELDQAAVDFGLTYMGRIGSLYNNGVNVSIPPYSSGQGLFSLADREPWLYDRATTVWVLAKRTGDQSTLDYALQLADTYMAGVTVASGLGTFNIMGGTAGDPTDVKYLYPTVAWWYEYETGNQIYRGKAEALYMQILQSFTKTYVVNDELWTERNVAFSILGCLAWHWISGEQIAINDATDYVNGVINMSAASGAPLHGHNQHEGSANTTPITSPWMGGFLVESMLQYYRTTDDVRIPAWIATYADFIHDHCCYVANGTDEPELAGLAGLRIPAYLAGSSLQFPEGESADMRHCIDVATLIRKGIWAKGVLNESATHLVQLASELEEAALVDIAYWTRFTEGYPKYRVNPPRSYGWQHRNRYSTVFYAGIVPMAPILSVAVSISGSTQQGSTLTATPGTWNGRPSPTLTYQWYRGNTPIVGATATTYDTVLADVGTNVTVRETATNAAGAVTQASNAIAVVAAGSPEITSQPSNSQAEVDQTATFTLTATGTPSPTYQWQVNTGSGWNNVSTGTGGTTDSYTTAALQAGDDGNQYRCIVSNAGGSVTSNVVTLTMVLQQVAARFAGDAAGASLNYAFGGNGFTNFVWEMLVYMEAGATEPTAHLATVTGVAGRMMQFINDNVFQQNELGFGDSNTGITNWASHPPKDTWLYVTLQSPNTAGGTIRATWRRAEGANPAATVAGTRTNGIEGSVPVVSLTLGGTGGINARDAGTRFQYVRVRTGTRTDNLVESDRSSTDPTGWDFWWIFSDNGAGGLAVTDATGNNRVPTLTGGTLDAGGPVVGGM
jgi:hypothetical protein